MLFLEELHAKEYSFDILTIGMFKAGSIKHFWPSTLRILQLYYQPTPPIKNDTKERNLPGP